MKIPSTSRQLLTLIGVWLLIGSIDWLGTKITPNLTEIDVFITLWSDFLGLMLTIGFYLLSRRISFFINGSLKQLLLVYVLSSVLIVIVEIAGAIGTDYALQEQEASFLESFVYGCVTDFYRIVICMALLFFYNLNKLTYRSQKRYGAWINQLQSKININNYPYFTEHSASIFTEINHLMEKNPHESRRLLNHFSEFLRYNLTDKLKLTTFSEELRTLNSYKAIITAISNINLSYTFQGNSDDTLPSGIIVKGFEEVLHYGTKLTQVKGIELEINASNKSLNLIYKVTFSGPIPSLSNWSQTMSSFINIMEKQLGTAASFSVVLSPLTD